MIEKIVVYKKYLLDNLSLYKWMLVCICERVCEYLFA